MVYDPYGSGEHDTGIGTLFARAIADAQELAKAQFELQKARVMAKVDGAKSGVILLVGAAVTGSMALTGLVVGALLILTPRLGPIGATGVVVGALSVVTGLLGWLALGRFKALFSGGDGA